MEVGPQGREGSVRERSMALWPLERSPQHGGLLLCTQERGEGSWCLTQHPRLTKSFSLPGVSAAWSPPSGQAQGLGEFSRGPGQVCCSGRASWKR